VLLALGYSGWGAGQLEEELARNVWLTTPADAHVLFETLPTEKYQQAVRLLGISEAMLSDVAGHA
jgi:putative transcriptional regulator